MSLRTTHLLLIAGLLGTSAIVHGWWTNRWATAAPAVSGFNLLDMDDGIGDWQPGAFIDVNPTDMPTGCQMLSRRFESTRAGKKAIVSVTCGHPGAVAVHTPDVCYLGSGFTLRDAVRQEKIRLAPDGPEATLYVADFQKNTASGAENIRVHWCWTADGSWQAPDYPRWFFARSPLLYKLYVVHNLSDDDDLTKEDHYRKFVAALLPSLSRHFAR
jgi:hypothetical protein